MEAVKLRMSDASNVQRSRHGFLDRHDFLLRRLHSLTGIVPIGVFLISHLLTNSSVVWGSLDSRHREHAGPGGNGGVAAFVHEVDFIHSIPFLLIIEITLWVALGFHSLYGLYIATTGRSNVARYGWWDNWRYNLQRISGYVGIVFILYHIATLRWGWTWLIPGGTAWSAEYAASTMALALRGGEEFTTAGLVVSAGYLIGVTLLVFHFANGLWTAAITWGVTISAASQRRWAWACGAVGVGMLLMGWTAVLGFAMLNPEAARRIEQRARLGYSAADHGQQGGSADGLAR